MMSKNEMVIYRERIENLKNKLVWSAIKSGLSAYLESKTDEDIDADIKGEIALGYHDLMYRIENDAHENTSCSFSIPTCIDEFYWDNEDEFPEIDIRNVKRNFELGDDSMSRILEMDCVKNFIQRFKENGLKTSVIFGEDQKMRIVIGL